MHNWALLLSVVSSIRLAHNCIAQNIILTNDDGWAVAQIRAQYKSLMEDGGFNILLSAPAENESGTGSSSATPQPLSEPCEFDTCPTGSPAEGLNASDTGLHYVNSFPVDAIRFGIQDLAPIFFGDVPEFVVSGPNVGNNLGTVTQNSGTVGAACEAAKEGIPAAAFSAKTASQVSYTTLNSANSSSTQSALLYAALTTNFTRTITDPTYLTDGPILPEGTILNINYAGTTFSESGEPSGDCATPSDFKWVFTRLVKNSSAVDVETCGSTRLPDETTVVNAGCFASVTVMNATTKLDVGARVQAQLLGRYALSKLLTCFDG